MAGMVVPPAALTAATGVMGRSRTVLATPLRTVLCSVTATAKSSGVLRRGIRSSSNNLVLSTGKSRGACPGYIIDHVKPLECGGADAPSNMQRQTKAEGEGKG
jgi:hypothetical protein